MTLGGLAAREAVPAADPVEPERPALPATTILELFDLIAHSSKAAERRFCSPMWQAWKVLLSATFGLAPPTEYAYPGAPETSIEDVLLRGGLSNQSIFELCTGRKTFPTTAAEELHMIVGRRGGKSQIAAILAIFLACCRDYSDELSPGETAMVTIIAPKREQTRVIFNYIKAIMKMVPALNALVLEYRKTDIELKNGLVIEPQTASRATSRGYTIVGIICDEIAFWRTTDDSVSADKDVLEALKPSMSTITGALLISLSSPYSRRGELYRNYVEHFGKDGDPILVWRADTLSMHPRQKLARVIEKAYAEDDVAAHAEYGAHFRTDLQALFAKDALAVRYEPGLKQRPFVKGLSYRAFVDPSGGSSDSMTLGIAHTERRPVQIEGKDLIVEVEILDLIREVRPPFSPKGVAAEFAGLCKNYRISNVVGDAYGGEWPREAFRDNGIGYELSEMNRSELYLETLPLVNGQTCELLDDRRMLNQFETLERRPGRGKDIVDHPPGGHDDCANAAAGALVAPNAGSTIRVRSLGR